MTGVMTLDGANQGSLQWAGMSVIAFNSVSISGIFPGGLLNLQAPSLTFPSGTIKFDPYALMFNNFTTTSASVTLYKSVQITGPCSLFTVQTAAVMRIDSLGYANGFAWNGTRRLRAEI